MSARSSKVVFYVTPPQAAAYKKAASTRDMRLGEWLRQELGLALERHAGFRRRVKKDEAVEKWPSGWPKAVACPQYGCGRIHTGDPAQGHNWTTDTLNSFLEALNG